MGMRMVCMTFLCWSHADDPLQRSSYTLTFTSAHLHPYLQARPAVTISSRLLCENRMRRPRLCARILRNQESLTVYHDINGVQCDPQSGRIRDASVTLIPEVRLARQASVSTTTSRSVDTICR